MPSQRPSLREAVALGLLQGPTELLPVSSSGHTTLIPWLCGWSYTELDPELRKTFEVALHAGAGLALAVDMRGELIETALELDRRHVGTIALSLAPPAVAGFVLERFVERWFGGPRSIAIGLIGGAVAMALADIRPGLSQIDHPEQKVGPVRGTRQRVDAGPRDGLALGLAQAAALIPGVSRNGATLTVARARGFARGEAQALSLNAGLGVILGASALKGARGLFGRGTHAEETNSRDHTRCALAAGGSTAFLSTLASARVLRRARREDRSLLPYALYRCLLAALVIRRLRDAHNRRG